MKRLKKYLEGLFEKAIAFIQAIDKEKVALVYDADVDGVVAAALISLVVKKMGKKIDARFASSFGKAKGIRKKLESFEKVIMVDVPTDLIKKFFLLEKEMLIIDHHPSEDLNSKKIIMVNPRLENPTIYQPTSYVVYKLFERELREKRWVAVIGTVGDMGTEDCRDLVKVKKENIWKSKYGKASMLLNGAISVMGAERVLEILESSKSLEDLMGRKELREASRKFEKEFDRCLKEYKKKLESWGSVIFSKIKPKYRGVCSALITMLSSKNPEKIIFIFEERGNEVRVHGRCGNKVVNVGGLFRKLGIGGGHEAAGAGTVKKKDENKIKRLILEELRDFTG